MRRSRSRSRTSSRCRLARRACGPAGTARAVERFCCGIIEAVAEHAVAVKPQLAFFEAVGPPALSALERICETARDAGLLVVLDGKRGDIGSTSAAYAAAYLSPAVEGSGPRGDALTVNPYLGDDGLEPFVAACRSMGAGSYVLVRTSNPGSADLQELELAEGASCGSGSPRSSTGSAATSTDRWRRWAPWSARRRATSSRERGS